MRVSAAGALRRRARAHGGHLSALPLGGLRAQALRDADEIKVVADGLVAEAAQIIRDLDRDGLLRPMPADRPPHPQAGHTLVLGAGSSTGHLDHRAALLRDVQVPPRDDVQGRLPRLARSHALAGLRRLQADLTAIRDEAAAAGDARVGGAHEVAAAGGRGGRGGGPRAARDEERVLFPTPRYVGEGACQRCHPAAYAAWEKSVHAKNMAIPTPETVIGDFGDVEYRFQGTRSRMFRRDGAWLMAYTDVKGRTETLRVDRTLGIKRHQAYLHARPDGRLQVLPTYWNQEERAWRDAVEGPVPGDAPCHDPCGLLEQLWPHLQPGLPRLPRQPAPQGYDPATNQYASTFEPAIGCEACHVRRRSMWPAGIAWSATPRDAGEDRAGRSG
ncbi:MAG: multiheme c-type cytochrome [bacterium]